MRARWTRLLPLFLLHSSCTLLLLPDAREDELEVRAVSATSLEGVAGATVAQPVTIQVVNARGRGVANVQVVFETPDGGTVSTAQQVTDAQGQATTTWTLGPVAGAQSLVARLANVETQQVSFAAQVRPGPTARVEQVSGDGQSGVAGEELAQDLVVRVRDAHGNPIPTATLTAVASGGTATPAQATSTPGEFRLRWRLGSTVRSYTLTVSGGTTAAARTTFTATAQPGAVARVERVSGSGQTGRVGDRLAQDLVVRLLDANGNAVPGATLVASAEGGVPVPVSGVSSASGEFQFGWRLGTVARSYTITAAAGSDVSLQTTFTATARPGPLASLDILSGDGQRVMEGAQLPDSLEVRASDAHGNAIAGLPVRWTVTHGGGSVSPSGATTTRADGTSRAAWSVGVDLANRLVASVGGLSVAFAATAAPRTPRVWVPVDTTFRLTPNASYLEIRIGDATPPPAPGQLVSLYYTAYRPDGSIYRRVRRGVDPPFQFRFRSEPLTVLPALNAGIAGMRRGGIRRIRMPEEHTENNGELFFEVELDLISP